MTNGNKKLGLAPVDEDRLNTLGTRSKAKRKAGADANAKVEADAMKPNATPVVKIETSAPSGMPREGSIGHKLWLNADAILKANKKDSIP
jgi:hypothetical protein